MNAQSATTTTPHPSGSPSMLPETQWQLSDNSEVSYNNDNGNNNSCSSGYNSSYGSGSPSSVASHELMQRRRRSVSSHSLLLLQHHHNYGTHHHNSLSALFVNPVRRVYSTGDLQRINGMQNNHHSDSPWSSECSIIIEGMSRACPYSPEEKKVRIERYRSKRNQRNFNKKIKYACRKTLADRRPRIRGRFARNEEIDKNPLVQWSHIGAEEEEGEEYENWVSIFDAANLAQESQGRSSFGLLY